MGISLPTLNARLHELADGQRQLQRIEDVVGAGAFETKMRECGLYPLRPRSVEILQVNVGKMCNQTCGHCHVDAGPDRTEIMTRDTMQWCVKAAQSPSVRIVDITGGAPEMNPDFFWFVEQLSALGKTIIDRCNLTILTTGAHRDTARFLAEHRVEVVCSLPHYRRPGTDAQRGDGVFDRSIEALRKLNALGYGDGENGLKLTLVTNPVGAFLPANQSSLQREWKRELKKNFDVVFDELYAITNMPISRYLDWLMESGNLEEYMRRLTESFNPVAASGVMCRDTVSVGWDGLIYDCDFNQMLEIGVRNGTPAHIRDFDERKLTQRTITVGPHCFGCTAGAGSSCTGVTS